MVIPDVFVPDARSVLDPEEVVFDAQTGMLCACGAALIHHLECGRGLARIMDAAQEQERRACLAHAAEVLGQELLDVIREKIVPDMRRRGGGVFEMLPQLEIARVGRVGKIGLCPYGQGLFGKAAGDSDVE